MRVLLVSMGSAGDVLPFIALGQALRARGHEVTMLGNGYAQRFFADSVAVAQSLGCRAVLLAPQGEQIPQRLPEGVCQFSYVPHSLLLPQASALVHHGGIGTALQALAAGIPQLIVPVFLDQPDNALRLARLGVAETVRRGTYRSREVCRKLEYLLDSIEVRRRCREYAVRCREANAFEKACVALERLFAASLPWPRGSRAYVSRISSPSPEQHQPCGEIS